MATRAKGADAIVQQAERPLNSSSPAAQAGARGRNDDDDVSSVDAGSEDEPGCTIKQLPERLQFKAAAVAAMINPVNEPAFGHTAVVSEGVLPTPLAIAVATAKYWGATPRTLTVSFMENTPAELRRRIVAHLNAWTRTGGVRFAETNGVGQVRISRAGSGYWSYLGTDILLIPRNRPTMNLQSFTMSTRESEYKRVVRHEAGHTLAFPHEHMRRQLVARIDRAKAYDYFLRTSGWDRATVDQQVLMSLDDRTIMGTPVDQDSIMCYQLPGSITVDGRPIRGGADINSTDYGFVGRIYPRASAAASTEYETSAVDDWPESEDVDVDDVSY
ncbi:MAG TPA: M12 family metallopeptidase [Thermoanaerobaculia bacterium]|nr:M12 family metallopeptidase [Thermoanaerobaculia bacterium]